MSRSTVIPIRLSTPEAAAVSHLLEHSALASCPGTADRVRLSFDGDLTMCDVASWPWSDGEKELIRVLRFLVGEEIRWPALVHLDDTQRLVVREALRLLGREGVR